MSKHQIIEVPGAIQNVEDETPIYIYSTINLYCGSMDITALIKEYQEEQYAEEEITEEVSEQEIQEEEREVWKMKEKQSKKIFTRMLMNNWGGISHKVMEFHEYVNLSVEKWIW